MSRKATDWLASLPPKAMNGSGFRVLFFLCNHHNDERAPERACYPSQDTLRDRCALSNGGLNKVLTALEEAGLIQRIRSTAPGEKTRRTYYILGCDVVGNTTQTPQSGERTNSTTVEVDREQTPLFGASNSTFGTIKLHPSGEEPVRNLGYGGGDAREPDFREPVSRPVSQPVAAVAEVLDPMTDRERILEACGADPVSGLTGRGGQRIGTRLDMHHVKSWHDDLGLSTDEQVAVIGEVMARKPDGPPASLKYFNEPMQRFAGAKRAEPLTPINPTPSNVTPFKGNRHDRAEQRHREDQTLDELIRLVSEGTLHRGPDPSDPFAGG